MYGGHPYGGAAYGDQQAGALVLVDYAGGGTLSYSGSSAENVTYAFAGSGTFSLSGSSVECVTRAEIGSSTLAFTGEADVDFVEAWASTGIIDFSGSSEQSFTWAWEGSGEIAFSGGADYEFASIPASSGGGGYPLGRWIELPTSPPSLCLGFRRLSDCPAYSRLTSRCNRSPVAPAETLVLCRGYCGFSFVTDRCYRIFRPLGRSSPAGRSMVAFWRVA